MSSSDNSQKKRNNYKLLVDPELRKGHKKLYRLNGKDVPGVRCSLIRTNVRRDLAGVETVARGFLSFRELWRLRPCSLFLPDAASGSARRPADPEDRAGHGWQQYGAGLSSLQGLPFSLSPVCLPLSVPVALCVST